MGIQVKNLTKSFSYYKKELGLRNSIKNLFYRETLIKEAVKGISFEIDNGEIVGFLGPNGAGKTTTLKMLSGILYPSSGEAYVGEYVPWERKKDFKMQFSIVMGLKSQLWGDLPAIESLNLSKHVYELDDKEFKKTKEELAEILDVKHLFDIQVRRLSLGERMKMELLASLIHRPKVLFLDEPTIGLDFLSQKGIRDFLKFYNQERKTTIILTSHYMNDIEDLCKRAIIINQGELIFDGDIREIARMVGNKKVFTMHFSEKAKPGVLAEYGKVRNFDGLSAVLEVENNDVKGHLQAIFNRFQVVDFTIENTPIEDGIVMLCKQGGVKN